VEASGEDTRGMCCMYRVVLSVGERGGERGVDWDVDGVSGRDLDNDVEGKDGGMEGRGDNLLGDPRGWAPYRSSWSTATETVTLTLMFIVSN